jgi:hypothetical protein
MIYSDAIRSYTGTVAYFAHHGLTVTESFGLK